MPGDLARKYIEEHDLRRLLQEALNSAIMADAEDPVLYFAKYFQGKVDRSRAKVGETTEEDREAMIAELSDIMEEDNTKKVFGQYKQAFFQLFEQARELPTGRPARTGSITHTQLVRLLHHLGLLGERGQRMKLGFLDLHRVLSPPPPLPPPPPDSEEGEEPPPPPTPPDLSAWEALDTQLAEGGKTPDSFPLDSMPTADDELDFDKYVTKMMTIILLLVKEGRMLANKVEVMVLDYLGPGARDAFGLKLS